MSRFTQRRKTKEKTNQRVPKIQKTKNRKLDIALPSLHRHFPTQPHGPQQIHRWFGIKVQLCLTDLVKVIQIGC